MSPAIAKPFYLFWLAVLFAGSAMAAEPAPTVPDAEFADGDFAAAEHYYGDVLAKSPDDEAALAGLARIRLYQERRADARALASRVLATNPDNDLAKRVLAGVAGRDASFAPDRYQITMPASVNTVRFVATDPLPIVRVRVNGTKTAYFLIDTGAPDLVVDETFAKELGLQSTATSQGIFAGGRHAGAAKSLLPRIDIGAVRVRNVPVTLMPTRNFAPKPGIRIDGIVGTGFLQHFLATLDYVHGSLVLRPRSRSQDFEASAAGRGGATVSMWLVGDHFIFARAKLNDGPEGLFNIDTGLAGGGLQATRAALDAAHIVPDESHVQSGQGGGGNVRFIPFRASASLGSTTVANVDGIFTPDGDQFGIFPFRVAGTLSHGFFRAHSLTFDFVAMRIVIT